MLLDKSFGSKSVLIMYNPQSVNTQHTTHRKGKIDAEAQSLISEALCVQIQSTFWPELAKLPVPQ